MPGLIGPPGALEATEAINCHDRRAGILGILPPNLPDLVCPSPQSLGLRERVHKSLTKETGAGLERLRMDILFAAKAIFEKWYGHSIAYAKLPASEGDGPSPSPVWNSTMACWDRPYGPEPRGEAPVLSPASPTGEVTVPKPSPPRVRRRYRLVFPARVHRAKVAGSSLQPGLPPAAKKRKPPRSAQPSRAKKRKPLESFRGLH